MDRWVEHYSNLYFRQNTVSPEAFDSLKCLQTMIELYSVPGIDKINCVIPQIKVPGSDNIPPDLT